MKNFTKLFIAFAFLALSASALNAQAVILDEVLTTQTSFNKFTVESIKGSQTWYFSSQYGACMSGFAGGESYENEDWFISPVMDLSAIDDAKLSFEHARGNASVINVGIAEGWYKVYATDNYTGNVSTTQWIEITGVTHGTTAWGFVNSGELTIPEAAKSTNTRIAFKYLCNNIESATWEVKNVRVTDYTVSQNEGIDFKVTTWNVSWLSCTDTGLNDKDRELQINNVVSVIETVNPDLIALQEVGTSYSYATIDTLVKKLGSEWAGNIQPVVYNNCNQYQGVIYKKSKVQLIGQSSRVESGNSGWAANRPPALHNVNLLAGNEQIPVSFINIHALAYGYTDRYDRRVTASTGLKTLLDGAAYNTKRIVIIGDFNDYLEGTQCGDCGGLSGVSPYKNFIDDEANYKGLTTNLTRPYPFPFYDYPVIDNIIISNELFDNYVSNSAVLEISATQTITNFLYTTTDHIPISATFRFSSVAEDKQPSVPSIQIYPNPTKGVVYISQEAEVKLYSLQGVLLQQTFGNQVDLSSYSSGMYLLQVDGKMTKVIKE